MRPITPIKSSQTARVAHTNSVINSTQQNIDYYNESGPIANQRQQRIQDQFNDVENRNLPSELQSRPKIPRTPLDGKPNPAQSSSLQ